MTGSCMFSSIWDADKWHSAVTDIYLTTKIIRPEDTFIMKNWHMDLFAWSQLGFNGLKIIISIPFILPEIT
ncbi:hypothetical protein HD554DRAFT_2170278 [Boletus coccyginus]|nr:hypothetical protein HD554DRAFT_2170278 [Boletus coccyginus]